MSPVRVQLSRKRGWRMPPNTLKVDRTTKWGNPFVPGSLNPVVPDGMVVDRRHAFNLYRAHAPSNFVLVRTAQAELRGCNLACWCPKGDDPYEDFCHAAVLLEIANADPPSPIPRSP